MMARPVRLAFVGVGDVAQRDYLPELARLGERAALAAVCGRGPERARLVGEEFGVPWFTDPVQMLGQVEIDAVVNLTPIPEHEEITRIALAAGRHVYTEKPLATTVAGASMLAEEARSRDLILVAAPSVMLFPQVLLARRLLSEGVIGEVRTVRGVTLGGVPPWLGYTSDPTPFFAQGAGPLVDLGVYALHAITGLVGPVQGVQAMSTRTRDHFVVADGPAAGARVPVEVDDAWVLLLELGEGCIGSLEANFTAHGTRSAELELMGTDGTMALSLLDVSAPVDVLGPDGEWISHEVEAARTGGPDHILGVEHLADLVSNVAAPALTAAHAIHVLDVIEAATESAQTHGFRRITSTVEEEEHHV